MKALLHVLLVLLILATNFIVFMLKIVFMLTIIFSLLFLCIKYETFGTIFFSTLLGIAGLGLLLMLVANACEVSAEIKRKGVRR